MTTYNSLADFLENGIETLDPSQTDEICPISRFEDDDEESVESSKNGPMLKTRFCGHHFHRTCLLTWLTDDGLDARSGCPSCRQKLYVGGFRGRGNALQAWVAPIKTMLSLALRKWSEDRPGMLKEYEKAQGLWEVVLRYQLGLGRNYSAIAADLVAVNPEDPSWLHAIKTASSHVMPERVPNETERVILDLEKSATEPWQKDCLGLLKLARKAGAAAEILVNETDDLVTKAELARVGHTSRGREAVAGLTDAIASQCVMERLDLQRMGPDLTSSQLIYWMFLVELAENMLSDLRLIGPL
ncbi:hypothetical protein K491DRAFT_762810 [Lophiostoma macrostomum CBS 122681]|uniref:Anaphase-promoting complex subunit 11 n=1 Tax=Lophiostoma macrostomum CBS 122681 TaxID=1314788 RepID=A0A6A6SQC8_9PLEO|nr:hypothetical protein K491DRAFT_762810 [Lophiostoma macrostomum CBS 122681]